ncbi:Fc.00g074280.m01.CDS01 [Cosmosporella sp. VM-42]
MASAGDEGTEHVGWTAQPRGRGTIGIIWSCLSVLILCSYKCIHLNISSRDEVEAGWHKWHVIPYWPERPLIRKYARKILWVFTILIAPEIGVGLAITQYAAACESLLKVGVKPLLPIRDATAVQVGDDTLKHETIREEVREKITLAHAFYANMGGFAQMDPSREETDRWVRDAALSDYVIFLQNATPEEYKKYFVSENDIGGLSKSDGITKLLAISQSIWLIAECGARAQEDMTISLFELTTMAYVVCAVVMYGFWWYKPYDVEYIVVFPKPRDPLPHIQREQNKTRTSGGDETTIFTFESGAAVDIPAFEIDPFNKPRNMTWSPQENFGVWQMVDILMFNIKDRLNYVKPLVFRIVATAFSAIHLVAWNWDFPSPPVRTLWRVFAVGCAANGPLLIFGNVVGIVHDWKRPRSVEKTGLGFMGGCVAILTIILGVTYVVMRLGLLVLTFYCLSSMPEDVYQTVDWTTVFFNI